MWGLSTETFAAKGIVVIFFALALSAAVSLMVRRQTSIWALAALLVLPVAVLFSLPDWRMFSWHGWLHFSIVYDIFERGVPPSFPLLAGYDLKYPYAFHFVVAQLLKVIPLAPSWFFATLSVACLLGTIVTLDRLASMISSDRAFRLLSISLALFGVGTLLSTPVGKILADLFGFPYENRLDPLHKFMEVGINQSGLLLFTISLLGLAKVVAGERAWPKSYGLFVCGFTLSGLIYPHAWLASGLVAAAACFQLTFLERPKRLNSAIALAALSGGASLLLLPWLLAIGAGKSGAGSFRPIDLEAIPEKLAILLLLLVIPASIAWLNRQAIGEFYTNRRPLLMFLFLAVAALLLSYLLVSMPASTGYKILMFSEMCMGLLLAAPLRALFYKHYLLALPVLVCFALPISAKIAPRLFFGWPVSVQAAENAIFVEPEDIDEHELYAWITENTSLQAVFVDTRLEVPVFARRALFVGLDPATQMEDGQPDGWYLPASTFIREIVGIGSDAADRRLGLARQLLDTTELPLDGSVVRQLRDESGGRPLYIIARDERVRTRLAATEHFDVMMENAAAMLLRLTDD